MKKGAFLILVFSLTVFAVKAQLRPQVEIKTSYGPIIIELYHETPLHRDNFLKLVQENIYDSLLFHRVIENFMVQAGDIKSKEAVIGDPLGSADLPYQIPAEIHPELFHQKGALGAARTNNPARASSSTQFYLVQGKIQNDSLLKHNEERINSFLQRHFAVNNPNNKSLLDSIELARESKDSLMQAELASRWESRVKIQDFDSYIIPEPHRKIYHEIGGTPHLDQNYTVFGQTISGMEVIDAIAAVATDSRDRPKENVYILKMTWLNPPNP